MRNIICVLLIIGLSNGLDTNKTDKSVVDIKAVSDVVLGVEQQFHFNCNATSHYTIGLLIDGTTNSTKYNRMSNTTDAKTNTVHFTFSETTPYDNGTTFQCAAILTDNSTVNFSTILTLQVEYSPRFAEGNNVTILKELPVDLDSNLSCTVLLSNPSLTSIVFTNTSTVHNNVHTEVNNKTGLIKFKKAKVANKGQYICTASNGYGTTTLTYETYVGGPPNNITISPSINTINGSLLMGLSINDNSNAPVLSLTISIPGIVENKVVYLPGKNVSIPVKNMFLQEIDESVEFVEAANYTFIVIAYNAIGNVTVVNKTEFVPGLNIDVDIDFHRPNVTRGSNFTFTCNAPKAVTFSVLIDGRNDSNKLKRIIKGNSTSNMTQEFIFINTTRFDNGTSIECVANNVYRSDVGLMKVFWPPFIQSPVKTQTLNAGNTTTILLNISSYPEVKYTQWLHNGVDIINADHLAPGIYELRFLTLEPRDNGSYKAIVVNDVGNTTVPFELSVLYAPVYSNTTVQLIGINGTNNAIINITDITGNPRPTKYTWTKNGVEIKSTKRVKIVDSISLMFNPVLQEDVGNYTVTAENSFGTGNGFANIDVYWRPHLQTPVATPTAVAGDTTELAITLNITAYPDVSTTELYHNGVNITTSVNISSFFNKITFYSLDRHDNGSYQAVLYNEAGSTTIPFDLNVLYPPSVNIESTKVGAFEFSDSVINITIDANPTNYTITLMKNGKPLKPSNDIIINKESITFKNITNVYGANYTINVTNILGSASEDFELFVYDGPIFMEGSANSSILYEIQDGSNHNITCTIKTAKPQVKHLMFEPSSGHNWKTVVNGNKSVTLVINKANAKNNTRSFTCVAINDVTTATLAFNNYVGGAPDKVKVDVLKTDKDSNIVLSLNVTDSSAAPATGIIVFLKGVMKKNQTLKLPKILLNGSSHMFDNIVNQSYTQLGEGVHHLDIYAFNMITTSHVKDYDFTITIPKAKKSHTMAIALGIAIPLAVLLLLAVVGGGGYYYWRSKKTGEYSPLSIQEGDGSKYGTDT